MLRGCDENAVNLYLEKPTRRIDLSKPPLPNNDVRPAPSRQYSEEAFMWEEERETISDKPEGPQKSKNVVESNADTEPARDDIYDTLTFGSIRVTEVINVRDVPSSSSEQPPGEPSLVSMKCSQPEISAFGESEATGATSQTETNVAVQASEPQPILPESTLLQSTSRDIEEIKRMLKEMQCKLEQVEFPADETCTPTDGQCCALQRKGLSTRQLNLFAFAVSSIVCVDTNNDLDLPPSLPETIRAVEQISSGKAPGSDAKHGGPRLMAELTTLLQEMRRKDQFLGISKM
ncbi:unnamed protein product [Schistocephalus solidus]|uniref:Fibrous sheath-interacting protein 1 n=1 Tax=Schistocephalus solidus TaxID=70667 RepID=A0A183T1I0_SCHSO|nr:unnamed protein product [Schistocephalus solidus]